MNFTNIELSRMGIEGLIALLDEIEGRIWSPWAILLVRFSDDTEPSPALTKYQHLFTASGSGGLNMVDFFKDMSHGKVDTSGTKVFGWYTLPINRADYVGNVSSPPPGKLNREGLLALAKATATNAKTNARVNLSDFAGVVVSGLEHVDLCGWLGGMAALCDTYSLSPSLLGQEMGHGYGLDHARLQGSTADYQDPWDVMSTAAFPWMQAPHPEFGTVGPGLNAWNMQSRGWLDETRVWTAPAVASWDAVVQLRPLHHHDLPGFLAAQIGPYMVEFRVPERWDAAIPRACVLVHRFQDNHSYLMPSHSGSQDIVEGDKFVVGDPNYLVFGYYAVEVTHIDAQNRTATVSLHHRPAHHVPIPEASQLLGGVTVDGGGAILVGGRIIKIPPWGPALNLVEQVARYLEVGTFANGVDTALAARREALAAVVREAIRLHGDAQAISEQPPGYTNRSRNRHQDR